MCVTDRHDMTFAVKVALNPNAINQLFHIHSGSGKTTLLNAVSGRQHFESGTVTLNGAKFDKRLRRRLAFVQQEDVFFSQLTLKETLVVRMSFFLLLAIYPFNPLPHNATF